MRLAQLVLAAAAAALSGWLLALQSWDDLRTDLLVFLGLYAAALIQTAVTTANLSLPDNLTVVEARALSARLERQQRYWVGLFATIAGAVLLLVFGSRLADNSILVFVPISFDAIGIPHGVSFDARRIISALLGSCFSLLLFHSFVFLGALLSIQRLRSQLLEQGAARRALAEAERVVEVAQAHPIQLPVGYGQIRRPH